jgi:hypothetical protein
MESVQTNMQAFIDSTVRPDHGYLVYSNLNDTYHVLEIGDSWGGVFVDEIASYDVAIMVAALLNLVCELDAAHRAKLIEHLNDMHDQFQSLED